MNIIFVRAQSVFFFKLFLVFIQVLFIYNAVLVSGIKQSDSAIY